MTNEQRRIARAAFDVLTEAERILSDAVQFGDTHEACVKALDLVRLALHGDAGPVAADFGSDPSFAVLTFTDPNGRVAEVRRVRVADESVVEAIRRLPGLRTIDPPTPEDRP